MEIKIYKYFVGYATDYGFGNGTVNSGELITTIEQIQEIEAVLGEDIDQTIRVISFQLLSGGDDDEN